MGTTNMVLEHTIRVSGNKLTLCRILTFTVLIVMLSQNILFRVWFL